MANDRLTTADAAKLAGVATSTIKRWADQGLIRFTRTAGGHRRYTRAVVERMLHGEPSETTDPMVDDWLACLIRLDRYELESRLMGARGELGSWARVADQLSKVLIELNRRVAPTECPAIWEGLRRGINRISDGLPLHAEPKACILAGVDHDSHCVGLSLAELCLREAGWNPRWLGQELDGEGVRAAMKASGPVAVFLDASSCARDVARLESLANQAANICRMRRSELF